jgi:hypothetical protein
LYKKGGLDKSSPYIRKTHSDESSPYIRIRIDKLKPYIRKIKTIQFIDIFKKVGLMNQAPT